MISLDAVLALGDRCVCCARGLTAAPELDLELDFALGLGLGNGTLDILSLSDSKSLSDPGTESSMIPSKL